MAPTSSPNACARPAPAGRSGAFPLARMRMQKKTVASLPRPRNIVNCPLTRDLNEALRVCFNHAMSTTLIEIRRAKAADAVTVAETHDEAWRNAYRGIIPGSGLGKLIIRRG